MACKERQKEGNRPKSGCCEAFPDRESPTCQVSVNILLMAVAWTLVGRRSIGASRDSEHSSIAVNRSSLAGQFAAGQGFDHRQVSNVRQSHR